MNIELNKKYFKKLDQELKLIPITYNFAFKKIFRSNLDILRDFLKVVIPLDITDDCRIKLMDGELPKENKNEKKKIVDIYVILDGKIYVDIEVNRSKFENVLERNVKYKNKLSSMIPKTGEDVKVLKEKSLYQLNLNAYPKEEITDDIVVLYGLKSKKIYSSNEYMIIKGLEKHRELYYSGIKEEDVIWLTALTSKNFSELYKIISQVLPEEKLKRFMEGAVGMSKDEFVLHEWNKELFDDLVKYNEIEDAKKEGKSLGITEGIKKRNIEIAKNMLNMKMSIEDISKATGLTIAEIQRL
ncbi:putative uncharacterized protein [Firmicutes bacterium CAG:822]|nr:putative uncharacterized protein [Firmicutes bacterium CAG:822]